MTTLARRLGAPVLDRRGRFSVLKTATFVALFLPALWMAYKVAAGHWDFPSPYVQLIYRSGVWATYLLLLSLFVTPARHIFRWRGLIVVRRMIGLAALGYTVAHLIIWFGLRFFDFSFIGNELVTRPTLIVATISFIGLIALGVTSLDAAIRWMGSDSWNRLHNAVYWLTALAVLHFLMSPGSVAALPFFMVGVFAWLMAWRVLDRRGLGTNTPALLALAVAAAVVAALSEAIWPWATNGENAVATPAGMLALNFDPLWWEAVGFSPAWQVLILGLAVALLGAIVRRGVPGR